MTKTNLLQGKMREKSYTLQSLAKAIGISRTTLFNKTHNNIEFTVSEVQKIADCLELADEEVQLIFFNRLVELNSTKNRGK